MLEVGLPDPCFGRVPMEAFPIVGGIVVLHLFEELSEEGVSITSVN